jgi:zinc-ribbon domain
MPQTCPQCQSHIADDAAFCPNCGAAVHNVSTATHEPAPGPTTPSAQPPRPPRAPAAPGYKFDAARWSLADRIAGIATVVLFVSLFLAWFGVSVIGITVTASGVSAHGYLYLVMIFCILIVAYLVLRAGWDALPGGVDLPHLPTMMAATLVNLLIVFIAFVALIAAIVAAAPYAIPQLRAKTMG